MADPWFDPNLYSWIPGTLLGVFGGTWGALAGTCAPKGRARSLVLGTGWMILGASVVMLIVAIVALSTGQPYGIWYGLGLPGVIGPIVIGANLPNVMRVYRSAEERKLSAGDL